MWSLLIDLSTIASRYHLNPPASSLTYCVAHLRQNPINVYRLVNDESKKLRISSTTMVNFVSFACMRKSYPTHFVFMTLVILSIFTGSPHFHMMMTLSALLALMSMQRSIPNANLMILSLAPSVMTNSLAQISITSPLNPGVIYTVPMIQLFRASPDEFMWDVNNKKTTNTTGAIKVISYSNAVRGDRQRRYTGHSGRDYYGSNYSENRGKAYNEDRCTIALGTDVRHTVRTDGQLFQ